MTKTVLLIGKQGLGTTGATDAEFGRLMMERFFHTLERDADKPYAICFYTEGVKLACRGSHVEVSLKVLASFGVRLVLCQTCLQHYGLLDSVAAGTVAGMPDIVRLIAEADKVISP